MRITDSIQARGFVDPSFIDLRTGRREPWDGRHNTLSYTAAESMAAAFGGDTRFVPNRIGIVFGTKSEPTIPIDGREQKWDDFKDILATADADIQIRPFSYSPSLSKFDRGDSSSSDPSDNMTPYGQIRGNAVTFHMHSDSTTAGYRGGEFNYGTLVYQAVLMNETDNKYLILARVSLENKGGKTKYYNKPDGFEVALDWTVKFF